MMYAYLDHLFYESMNRYHLYISDYSLLDGVKKKLPNNWNVKTSGIWSYYTPYNENLGKNNLSSGWKIHISSTGDNGLEVLEKVTDLLIKYCISFKHLSDCKLIALSTSKNWSRPQSGKFITIYPNDIETFKFIIEELYLITKNDYGPYIFSDFRYKDSGVVFYRYGGFIAIDNLKVTGERESFMKLPSGTLVKDQRNVFPFLPKGVENPFKSNLKKQDKILLNKKWDIKYSLHFSNSGGIYVAQRVDSNKKYIIKEAKPYVDYDKGADARTRLNREFECLQLIMNLKIGPKPIEIFEEWNHLFIVEEFIEGTTLASMRVEDNSVTIPLLEKQVEKKINLNIYRLLINLVAAIKKIHQLGLVYGDLSPRNVLITSKKTYSLRIIDFEASFIEGKELSSIAGTLGFISPQKMNGKLYDPFKNDYFAIGALISDFLLPIGAAAKICPDIHTRFIRQYAKNNMIDKVLGEILCGLLCHDEEKRFMWQEVKKVIVSSGKIPQSIKNLAKNKI